MLRPTLVKLPTAVVPKGSSNDYACGSYEGNTDFSCSPYGSNGNIDMKQEELKESTDEDWTISLTSTVIGGVLAGVFAT